jgi:tRNA modification GTPase
MTGSLPDVRKTGVRELRDPVTGELLDQAMLLRFDGPASSTGEDVVEFHCHGGRAVVDGLLHALACIDGLRHAEPGEFTRRAFESGRIDLTEAEGLADLIEAETETQRKAALALAEGGLRKQIATWQETALMLSAMAERAIDYDDDDEALDPELPRKCGELAADLARWLRRPRIEPLKDGVRVVVAGPPNAGKSSLINAIAGEERAIVTDVPGTTRDHIEVPLALGGVPIRLTDTAGLRETTDQVEAIGVERTGRLINAADVLVWLGDAKDSPEHPNAIFVHAKADLAWRGTAPVGSIAVSSVTHDGIAALLRRVELLARLVLPADDQIALNRRQATLMGEAYGALEGAASSSDVVVIAEELRHVRTSFDQLTGRAGVEDVLDALFARFCLGK